MPTKTAPAPSKAAPKADTIKPEKLPVDLGGGRIEFVKRADYAKRTAENFSIAEKAEIKRDHVTQVLDALDAGQSEITEGENPPEFVKLFNLVNEDYQAGKEEVQRLAKEEADKKAKEEADAKAKAEAEENLFVAVKDTKSDFSTIAENFDTGNMDRFIAKADATVEDLFAALGASFGMSEFTNWMQGDIVVALEARGQINVVSKVAEAKGVSYSGLYNKARTCKAFPPEKRNGVSYTICAEVACAKFTKEQEPKKLALVEKVLAGKVNTQEARKEVRAIQGKEEPQDLNPEDDEKFMFIVVDPNADISQIVNTSLGFPKELFANGAIIINPKTKKQFAKNGFAKKAENRWEDMPVYSKPAATAETKPAAKKGKK